MDSAELFKSKPMVNRFMNYRIPLTSIDFSQKNIFCDRECGREHKMHIRMIALLDLKQITARLCL